MPLNYGELWVGEISKGGKNYTIKDATAAAAINVINGEGEGSISKAVEDAKAEAATDAQTKATQALNDAKTFTGEEIGKLSDVYDEKGAAATAKSESNKYTDEAIEALSSVYATPSDLATAKQEAISAAESKVNALAGTDWTAAAGTVKDIIDELNSGEGKGLDTLVDKLKDLEDDTVKEYVDDAVSAVKSEITGSIKVEGNTLIIL